MSDSLQLHELQHARLPCPSLSLRVCSNSCSLGQWCHPTVSSSVCPFSLLPSILPSISCFPVSQLFPSGGQSIGALALASILPMKYSKLISFRRRSRLLRIPQTDRTSNQSILKEINPDAKNWYEPGQSLEDSEGQGSQVCYSPWGLKEWDTAWALLLSIFFSLYPVEESGIMDQEILSFLFLSLSLCLSHPSASPSLLLSFSLTNFPWNLAL